jgi:hypothetical protein
MKKRQRVTKVGSDIKALCKTLIMCPQQNQNDYLREWLTVRDQYLFEVLEMESPKSKKCCQCGSEKEMLRCMDCFGRDMFCNKCFLSAHAHLPFHHIEKWSGTCFSHTTLFDEGFILHVGHGRNICDGSSGEWIDEPCHHLGAEEDSTVPEDQHSDADDPVLVIVHTTGVFQHTVRWCTCSTAPKHDIQLLRSSLFPASMKLPRTAFTFDVLDHFYIDSMECKTSAHSFFMKLRRLTNCAFPDQVQVHSFIILFIHFF